MAAVDPATGSVLGAAGYDGGRDGPPIVASSSSPGGSTYYSRHPLSPRGICRSWKEMKNRAVIQTGVSLTFLEMVATSPVTSLLPSLPPYSPRSPSALLLHKRLIQQQPPNPSPKLHRAIARESNTGPPSSPLSEPHMDTSSGSGSSKHTSAINNCYGTKSGNDSNVVDCNSKHRLSPSETLFICVAWMMWLWGRFVFRFYCLLVWWGRPTASSSSSSFSSSSSSSLSNRASASKNHNNRRSLVVTDASATAAVMRRAADVCREAKRSTHSSSNRALKLRSSFKSLSIQVPRKSSHICSSSSNSDSPFPRRPKASATNLTPLFLARGNSNTTTPAPTSPSPRRSSTSPPPLPSCSIVSSAGGMMSEPSPPPLPRHTIYHSLAAAPITLGITLAGLLLGKAVATGLVISWLMLLRILSWKCCSSSSSSK